MSRLTSYTVHSMSVVSKEHLDSIYDVLQFLTKTGTIYVDNIRKQASTCDLLHARLANASKPKIDRNENLIDYYICYSVINKVKR